MKVTTLAVLAAAAIAIAAPALAQNPPTPEERAARFDAGDKDKNGKLTKAEFTDMLPEQAKANADMIWGRIDAEGKGEVTKEQYLAFQPRRPQ